MIEQMTIVYHTEYGKGYVVNNTLKGKDFLVMCRFGKHVDWSMASAIKVGTGSITLAKAKAPKKPIDDLSQSIESILFGGG